MLKLDNNLLEELGLGTLPEDQKRQMLQHIYETLELRVGTQLANQMTDKQLEEFEKFIDAGGDANQAQALQWLETNLPNYKQVVQDVFEALKAEVKGMAPQLLVAAAQQPQQPAMSSAQPMDSQASYQTAQSQQYQASAPMPQQPYQPEQPLQQMPQAAMPQQPASPFVAPQPGPVVPSYGAPQQPFQAPAPMQSQPTQDFGQPFAQPQQPQQPFAQAAQPVQPTTPQPPQPTQWQQPQQPLQPLDQPQPPQPNPTQWQPPQPPPQQ